MENLMTSHLVKEVVLTVMNILRLTFLIDGQRV